MSEEQPVSPPEVQQKKCKKCGIRKSRIAAGKFDLKNKKWVDESGKLWNGHVCPPCNVLRSKENMQMLRKGYC